MAESRQTDHRPSIIRVYYSIIAIGKWMSYRSRYIAELSRAYNNHKLDRLTTTLGRKLADVEMRPAIDTTLNRSNNPSTLHTPGDDESSVCSNFARGAVSRLSSAGQISRRE